MLYLFLNKAICLMKEPAIIGFSLLGTGIEMGGLFTLNNPLIHIGNLILISIILLITVCAYMISNYEHNLIMMKFKTKNKIRNNEA